MCFLGNTVGLATSIEIAEDEPSIEPMLDKNFTPLNKRLIQKEQVSDVIKIEGR